MSKAECVCFPPKVDTSDTENNLINLALNETVRSDSQQTSQMAAYEQAKLLGPRLLRFIGLIVETQPFQNT